MTCKDTIDILADFLDQTLTSSAVEQLDAHLRDCAPCRAYLNTYRKTRGLVGEAGRVEMPDELKARLRDSCLNSSAMGGPDRDGGRRRLGGPLKLARCSAIAATEGCSRCRGWNPGVLHGQA
jgi:hypothetical protein